MAGDWIKFELITLDKPEVCQIADLADIDPDAVVGKLLRVWGWFDQQTADGNAPSVTKRLLDRMTGVIGFCEHMKAVGWMIEVDGVISLPNFERHNGKTAKNRLLTAKRVANHKAANGKGNARSVSSALPREDVEKSKELNPSHTPADVRDEPSAGGSPPAAPPPTAGPVPMTLDWEPDQRRLQALAVRAGLPMTLFAPEAIAGFVIHHEAKGLSKTANEWLASLVNWVKRDAEQAKSAASQGNVRPFPARQGAEAVDFDSVGWLGGAS
jgi:hypothetical protein